MVEARKEFEIKFDTTKTTPEVRMSFEEGFKAQIFKDTVLYGTLLETF